MRTHVSAEKVGERAREHWVEIGVIPVSTTGHHYTGRVSTSADSAPAGRVELRGQAGTTVLWQGALAVAATLVPLPATLPGERLVFAAQAVKKARFTLELAWVEPGETTPAREDQPCSP